MGRLATTLDEQIALLRSRNMIIEDEDKTKEILFDIGYFRMGFYWFPFEESYPRKMNRTHFFKIGTDFEDAVKLYYFDFHLRNLLIKPLTRIEIAFRTKVVYIISNCYKASPTWFVDFAIVRKQQTETFEKKVYNSILDKEHVIARHHRVHINDKFAPAWKTLEFMTLGEMVHLFKAVRDDKLKLQIANEFGIKQLVTFENYLELVKDLRNACAHGNVLFDFTPEKSIRKGPAMMKGIGENQNLNGALRVILYMMKQISENRYVDLIQDIDNLIIKYSLYPKVINILYSVGGLDEFHRE